MTTVTAETVQNGHLILYRVEDKEIVGLKGIRHGKDHINHYFIPLEPISEDPLTVIYIDCTASVRDCHDSFTIKLNQTYSPVLGKKVEVGSVLSNETGTYIKVREQTKGIMSLVYVNLDNGELKRRQERQIHAVYSWSLTCTGADPR